MAEKYNLAIVGNKNTILGFKALGMTAMPANNPEEAKEVLFKLKNEKISENNEERPKYAIIFIMEDLAKEISDDDYKKLTKHALPAIIPLPGIKGSTGLGLKRIGKMVEQAVGSDIF